MRKRLLMALLVAGLLGGGMYAFAATLTVGSEDGDTNVHTAAGSVVVASCDTDGVAAEHTVDFESGAYRGITLEISDIDATGCAGEIIEATQLNTGGTVLATCGPQTIGAGDSSFSFDFNTANVDGGATGCGLGANPTAAELGNIHITIHDAP